MTRSANGLLMALRRAHRRLLVEPDRGTTMVEVVTAMVIMTICGAIFVGAVVTLSRTSNQAQAMTDSANQNNQAYQALEKTVRYAATISTPGVSSGAGATGDWYVELRRTTTAAEVCTQLRVDLITQQLQTRSWSAADPTTLSSWRPLASSITNGAATTGSTLQPFVLLTPGATAVRQQLKVTLVARSGPASQPVASSSSYTLTAANSVAAPSGSVCQQVGRP